MALPRSFSRRTSSRLVPAAAKTCSLEMSGVKYGGPRTPASMTVVFSPAAWRRSRMKPSSGPLVSRVPTSTMGMEITEVCGASKGHTIISAKIVTTPPSRGNKGACSMSLFTRDQCLQRLRAQIAAGRPIIGGGAGTGISAKCAEAGGIDLIIIYNSGRFRMAGRGSLSGMMPYGDANQIVMDMAREVLPVVKKTPVLAGVCGTDPFRIMKLFLREIQALGFSGVQNFPTVGLIDGTMRQGLEETDMGYDKEVDMIRQAREFGLLTCPYV